MIRRHITRGQCSSTILVVTMTFVASATPSIHGSSGNDDSPPTPRVELPDESQYRPSPADGKGTVTVTPQAVRTLEPTTLTFVYSAAAEGIAPGGGVGWCLAQRSTQCGAGRRHRAISSIPNG